MHGSSCAFERIEKKENKISVDKKNIPINRGKKYWTKKNDVGEIRTSSAQLEVVATNHRATDHLGIETRFLYFI